MTTLGHRWHRAFDSWIQVAMVVIAAAGVIVAAVALRPVEAMHQVTLYERQDAATRKFAEALADYYAAFAAFHDQCARYCEGDMIQDAVRQRKKKSDELNNAAEGLFLELSASSDYRVDLIGIIVAADTIKDEARHLPADLRTVADLQQGLRRVRRAFLGMADCEAIHFSKGQPLPDRERRSCYSPYLLLHPRDAIFEYGYEAEKAE
jgi:hypothetical protein